MSSEFAIRPMTAADLDAVMVLAAGLANVPRWSPQSWQVAIQAPQVSLVAAEGDQVQGFAVAAVVGGVAELESMAVGPAVRRRGLGRRLLSDLAAELGRSAVAEIWLEVRVSNQAAIALYRGAGFEETGRRRAYYRDPVEDAVLMRLVLR